MLLLVLSVLFGFLYSARGRSRQCGLCGRPNKNRGEVCDKCLQREWDERQLADGERTRRFRTTEQLQEFSSRAFIELIGTLFKEAGCHVVMPGATPEQIKSAYRLQMTRYHPDRVAQLGPELQQLAVEKSMQINQAYRALTR
jgi:DnaJ-domain-containing protein 1